MSFLLRKATELGVSSIIPVVSERAVIKDVNIERWRKIVEEASKQSLRISVPEVKEKLRLNEFLKETGMYDVKILLSPCARLHIGELLDDLPIPKKLVFLTGPEGGFTEREVRMAGEYGFLEVSLGKRVLRAETVPLVFLSILEYKWGRYEGSI